MKRAIISFKRSTSYGRRVPARRHALSPSAFSSAAVDPIWFGSCWTRNFSGGPHKIAWDNRYQGMPPCLFKELVHTPCYFAAANRISSVWTRNISTEVSGRFSENPALWAARYQELVNYIEEHGNSMIPQVYEDNPALGKWVNRQRTKYKANNLSPERIKKLNEVGFLWDGKEALRLEQYEPQWMDRLGELLQYKNEHGNTLVPQGYEDNLQLGRWVCNQRHRYKNNQLPPKRVQKLNEIGFVWDPLEAQWLERFHELRQYKNEHGNTLVPVEYSENPPFGRWVHVQRKDYKKFMAKKKLAEDERLQHDLDDSEVEKIMNAETGMTKERIRLLEAEDFIWNPHDHAWQLKYDELCKWVDLNGHGAIRQGKEYDPLKMWADRQRQSYKKYLKGEKARLPKETIEKRIEKLKWVGFVFDL